MILNYVLNHFYENIKVLNMQKKYIDIENRKNNYVRNSLVHSIHCE